MTTTGTPAPVSLIPVDIKVNDGADGTTAIAVLGEPTPNPHLVIAPYTNGYGYTGAWSIVHMPTGLSFGHYWLEPHEWRQVAESVADLDWATDDPDVLRRHAKTAKEAIRVLEMTEPTAAERPTRDNIPRAAGPLLAQFLAQYQWHHNRMFGPDQPELSDQQLAFHSAHQVNLFGLAYLLAALRLLDPEVADSAAAFLADQWAAGDSLGEFMWQWQREIATGQPLDLPGIPRPLNGPLFAPIDTVAADTPIRDQLVRELGDPTAEPATPEATEED